MRLDYIRSFINVVNCKSFSVAAKKAFVSQPTISTHIKQLEAELGVQLLVRSTKDVILSEEGVLFYPYAVRLLETENEALAHLNKTEAKVKGTVTIAASSVPGNYILPRILKQTRLKYPEIDYRMLEGDSSQVIVEHCGDIYYMSGEISLKNVREMENIKIFLVFVKLQLVRILKQRIIRGFYDKKRDF